MPRPISVHVVIICGDREWLKKYIPAVRRVIRKLKKKHGDKLLLVQGGAPGVDSMVGIIADQENVHCAEIKALWKQRGRSAGPQRNKMMLAVMPDEVIGIHENFKTSTGTAGMCSMSEDYGIPVTRIEP